MTVGSPRFDPATPDQERVLDLGPGDWVKWKGRSEPCMVVRIREGPEEVPPGQSDWDTPYAVDLLSKRNVEYQITLPGGGVRLYRRSETWKYNEGSEGKINNIRCVDQFIDASIHATPPKVQEGEHVVTELNPQAVAKVIDPSDPVGHVIVEEYPGGQEAPYAVAPDEILAWQE